MGKKQYAYRKQENDWYGNDWEGQGEEWTMNHDEEVAEVL